MIMYRVDQFLWDFSTSRLCPFYIKYAWFIIQHLVYKQKMYIFLNLYALKLIKVAFNPLLYLFK